MKKNSALNPILVWFRCRRFLLKSWHHHSPRLILVVVRVVVSVLSVPVARVHCGKY